MALAIRSTGILETYVHWEEVEEEMQKALNTSATFGPNKTVKNIGEGNGFTSRVALIHPDWQNGSNDLPKAFIAKICSALTVIEFSEKRGDKGDNSFMVQKVLGVCKMIHNLELDSYRVLNKYSDGRLPLPKIYYSRKFSEDNETKGYILMEFFENLVPCHINDNVQLSSIKKVLRSVAIWQSIGLKMTEEERNIFSTTFLSDNLSDFFTAEMIEQTRKGFINFCGSEHSELIEQYADLMKNYCTQDNFIKLDSLPDRLGFERVFCHGDLWCTNILWTKTDGVFDVKAHIDFQGTNFCTPAVDINRVLSACLSGSDRRKHYKELLSTFYGYLQEEVDGELPYTLEQLEQSYNYFTPLSSTLVLSLVDQLFEFFKKEKPDCAEQIKECLLEKTLALIEDAVRSFKEYRLE